MECSIDRGDSDIGFTGVTLADSTVSAAEAEGNMKAPYLSG